MTWTKKRLALIATGGVFVAIIFVPMLFDEQNLPDVSVQPIDYKDTSIEFDGIPEIDSTGVRQAREDILSYMDSDGFRLDSGVRLGEPVLLPDSLDAISWAILLDTFKDKADVDAYRRSLAELDVDSWVSTRKDGSELLFDVATGPFIERESVEARAVDLANSLSESVTIVVYDL